MVAWLHHALPPIKLKALNGFMPTSRTQYRVTKQGIKKAMANETEVISHNCLNFRQVLSFIKKKNQEV